MKVTDTDLTVLRSQTEFNAVTVDKIEWRKLADALAELQERREEEARAKEALCG